MGEELKLFACTDYKFALSVSLVNRKYFDVIIFTLSRNWLVLKLGSYVTRWVVSCLRARIINPRYRIEGKNIWNVKFEIWGFLRFREIELWCKSISVIWKMWSCLWARIINPRYRIGERCLECRIWNLRVFTPALNWFVVRCCCKISKVNWICLWARIINPRYHIDNNYDLEGKGEVSKIYNLKLFAFSELLHPINRSFD